MPATTWIQYTIIPAPSWRGMVAVVWDVQWVYAIFPGLHTAVLESHLQQYFSIMEEGVRVKEVAGDSDVSSDADSSSWIIPVLQQWLCSPQHFDYHHYLPRIRQDSVTSFRQRVWQAVCEIPCGSCLHYGELAAQLGTHPRAVGAALAQNRVALLIPCHRVIPVTIHAGKYYRWEMKSNNVYWHGRSNAYRNAHRAWLRYSSVSHRT